MHHEKVSVPFYCCFIPFLFCLLCRAYCVLLVLFLFPIEAQQYTWQKLLCLRKKPSRSLHLCAAAAVVALIIVSGGQCMCLVGVATFSICSLLVNTVYTDESLQTKN